MKIVNITLIFLMLNMSGCVLNDYYQQDCAINGDYYKQLPSDEQKRLNKKCGGAPQWKLVKPDNN